MTCAYCGVTAPDSDSGVDVPLTWTTAVENGRPRHFCATCSRENLRAIEGKLDSEFW